MRLIDATELEKIWEKQKARDQYNGGGYLYSPQDILDDIEEAETIDAVPVVRCVECKHRDPENHHCDHPAGTTIYFPRKDDDFCSYGEKRGE